MVGRWIEAGEWDLGGCKHTGEMAWIGDTLHCLDCEKVIDTRAHECERDYHYIPPQPIAETIAEAIEDGDIRPVNVPVYYTTSVSGGSISCTTTATGYIIGSHTHYCTTTAGSCTTPTTGPLPKKKVKKKEYPWSESLRVMHERTKKLLIR